MLEQEDSGRHNDHSEGRDLAIYDYRNMIDQHVLFLAVDRDGIIRDVNERYCSASG